MTVLWTARTSYFAVHLRRQILACPRAITPLHRMAHAQASVRLSSLLAFDHALTRSQRQLGLKDPTLVNAKGLIDGKWVTPLAGFTFSVSSKFRFV
jgi:hypothetical protein